MSDFWSTWVIVLAVVTFGISFLLLCWAPWVKIPTQSDGTTTHVWAHGVLREGVKDLPRWWLIVSYLAFAAAALYVLLFPGLGNYRGLLNWTSTEALQEAAARNDELMATLVQRVRDQPIEQLAADPEASRIGRRLFVDNCAACHGATGKGNTALGAPDLTDRTWLYGGSLADIEQTIRAGRSGVMPAWRDRLGEDGARLVAAWVYGNANTIRPSQ